MNYERIWERAREHFSQRTDSDMEAHARAVVAEVERLIDAGEPGDRETAVIAAILHDVGIPQAMQVWGDKVGPLGQEVEGAVIARDILAEEGCPPDMLEAICGMIGIHHHKPQHPTPEFRLLYDADMLVNMRETGGKVGMNDSDYYSDTARETARLRANSLRDKG